MPSLPNSTPKCRKFSHRGFAGHIAITFYTNNEKKRHRMSHARQTWDMPNITDGTYYYCFSIKSFNKFYILFNSISPFFPSIFPYDSVFFHFFLFALFVFKLQHFFLLTWQGPGKITAIYFTAPRLFVPFGSFAHCYTAAAGAERWLNNQKSFHSLAEIKQKKNNRPKTGGALQPMLDLNVSFKFHYTPRHPLFNTILFWRWFGRPKPPFPVHWAFFEGASNFSSPTPLKHNCAGCEAECAKHQTFEL